MPSQPVQLSQGDERRDRQTEREKDRDRQIWMEMKTVRNKATESDRDWQRQIQRQSERHILWTKTIRQMVNFPTQQRDECYSNAWPDMFIIAMPYIVNTFFPLLQQAKCVSLWNLPRKSALLPLSLSDNSFRSNLRSHQITKPAV